MYKSKTMNKYLIFIGFLLLLNCHFFYLINENILPVQYSDISLLCALVFEAYIFIKFFWIHTVKYQYAVFIFFALFLMVCSAYMANVTYGQPFMMGLLPQRSWIVWLFAYFPLVKLLKLNRINVDQLIKVLYIVAIVYLAIVTLQYLLPNITFLYVSLSTRYGETRMYVGDSAVMILAGHALYKAFKDHSIKHALFFVWCIVLESIIMKGRAGTVTMLIAVLICLILERNSINKRLFHVLLVLGVGLLFLQTDMGQQLSSVLQGNADMETGEVREAGRALYIQLLQQSWMQTLFGCGYANNSWDNAVYIIRGSGQYEQQGLTILTTDNGMYGFALYYGLIGILWAVSMYIVCFKNAWKVYRASGNFMFLFFLIWDILGFQTLYWDCAYALLEFPLFLALLEIYTEYYKNKQQVQSEDLQEAF